MQITFHNALKTLIAQYRPQLNLQGLSTSNLRSYARILGQKQLIEQAQQQIKK